MRHLQIRGRASRMLLLLVVWSIGACGGQQPDAQPQEAAATQGESATIRLYTAVSEEPVTAVVDAFRGQHPGVEVEVFRAPTAELNGRIAAERRQGRVGADLLWMADPLSLQRFAADGLLRQWEPAEIDVVPAEARSETFFGTHLLEVVAVVGKDVEPVPQSWADLASPALADAVAVPDPTFAGSAFGALGFFAMADGYGLDFYERLASNGAVQVSSPTEVLTGVAEGRFKAGMTLSFQVRDAAESGAPVVMVRPAPGAITIYSPIAVLADSKQTRSAEAFVDFLLSTAGQQLLVDVGGYEPIRDDVEGHSNQSDRAFPDWDAVFDRQEELLEEYGSIFGG